MSEIKECQQRIVALLKERSECRFCGDMVGENRTTKLLLDAFKLFDQLKKGKSGE